MRDLLVVSDTPRQREAMPYAEIDITVETIQWNHLGSATPPLPPCIYDGNDDN